MLPVIITYFLKKGCEQQFLNTIHEHWEELYANHLVSENAAIVFKKDEDVYVEMYEWLGEEENHKAHYIDSIVDIWNRLDALTISKDIKTIRLKPRLQLALENVPANFVDIRLEKRVTTTIHYSGTLLETASVSYECGGYVRALVNGGWGSVCFQSFEHIEDMIEQAILQASLVGASFELGREGVLATAEPVEDKVKLDVKLDPRTISLEEKITLLRIYNERMLNYNERITSTQVRYFDKYTERIYCNTEGTYIEQEHVDLAGNFRAMASDGNLSESHRIAVGSSEDFSVMYGLEKELDTLCEQTINLLEAEEVEHDEYTVVLNPELTGAFVHEVFGHLCEADMIVNMPELENVMQIGSQLGSRELTIYDTGETPGARGRLVYDDEGVKCEKQYLVQNGVFAGRLHDRQTAALFQEKPTGNSRALSYKYPPIPRMRNTCMVAGSTPVSKLFDGIERGIYAVGFNGGETNGTEFTLVSSIAWMIREGKLAEMVKNVSLSGNVFDTIQNIEQIGDDFTKWEDAGGCSKSGQNMLPVSSWAPHVRIRKLKVGGL